jgi:hypothetical protein
MIERRRFPPPWSVEEANAACFIVKDQSGHALAYGTGHKKKGGFRIRRWKQQTLLAKCE